MRVEGCYSIRDRNVWLTEAMCENNCLRPETLSSSPNALPDFMSGASVSRNGESAWGRRGRAITRNMRQGELTAPNNGAMRIITANNMRNTNIVRNSNTAPVLRTQTLGTSRNGVINGGQTLGMNRNGVNGGQTLGMNRNGVNGGQTLGMSRNTVNEGQMQASTGLTAGRSNSVRVVQVSPRGNGNGNAQLPGSKVVASLFRT